MFTQKNLHYILRVKTIYQKELKKDAVADKESAC